MSWIIMFGSSQENLTTAMSFRDGKLWLQLAELQFSLFFESRTTKLLQAFTLWLRNNCNHQWIPFFWLIQYAEVFAKYLGSENFGETAKHSQNGTLTNITKSDQLIGKQWPKTRWTRCKLVLRGEQVANTSMVDENSLGMRNEYNDAFRRSSYFSQMNHEELSIKLLPQRLFSAYL